MYQLNINRNTYQKLKNLLPDFKPDIIIDLVSCDINLEKLGFCKSAPCVVNIDIDKIERDRIMDEINRIEEIACTCNLPINSEECKRYEKYGWIWNYLFYAEQIK